MIGRFLFWWIQELTGLLPAAMVAERGHRGPTLRFQVQRNAIEVSYDHNGRAQIFGQVGRDGTSGSSEERVRALIAGLDPESTACEVSVDPSLGLIKEVSLPGAAEENLREVLGFEMERQTPFKSDDVYFDVDVMGRDQSGQSVDVMLRVVPRSIVNPALELAVGWDLEPAATSRTSRPNRPDRASREQEIGLWFRSSRFRAGGSGSWGTALLVINLLLLAAVIAVPLFHQQQTLDGMREHLTAARDRATAAMAIEEQIGKLRADVDHLRGQREIRPAAVEVLEELSARLPDSTWLFRLEIRGRTVHLQGSSQAASSLIATLEESPILAEVQFDSPVVREGNAGRERFQLSAKVLASTARDVGLAASRDDSS